jgi:hypothetical protein
MGFITRELADPILGFVVLSAPREISAHSRINDVAMHSAKRHFAGPAGGRLHRRQPPNLSRAISLPSRARAGVQAHIERKQRRSRLRDGDRLDERRRSSGRRHGGRFF